MLENIMEISILYDLYGELLPEKQREIFRLYHEDNFSLSEIGSEFDMTRQGVHEAVKRSEEKLTEYEKKLGLATKFRDTEAILGKIDRMLEELIKEKTDDKKLAESLTAMRKAMVRLDR
jgi:uncharacterized protein